MASSNYDLQVSNPIYLGLFIQAPTAPASVVHMNDIVPTVSNNRHRPTSDEDQLFVMPEVIGEYPTLTHGLYEYYDHAPHQSWI